VLKRCLRTALARHEVKDANGHSNGNVQKLVSCGRPRLSHQIKIVDPEAQSECGPDSVGEIWLRGPSVAAGYWNRPLETAETFQARLDHNDEETFLRTGDLGFVSEGELYITGRVKDVIIIRGRNLYPQDIERTVSRAHAGLRLDAGAAFAIEVLGEEQLGIVHEVDRSCRHDDLSEVARRVRRLIIEEHEVDPHVILLIRQASLPITSSGKVQRSLCRTLYREGQLKVHHEWVNEQSTRRTTHHATVAESSIQSASAADEFSAAATNSDAQAKCRQAGSTIQSTQHGRSRPTNGASNTTPAHHGNGTAKTSPGTADSSRPVRATPAPVMPNDRPMTADEVDRLAERIEIWLMDWLTRRAQVPRNEIRGDKPFADYGLDSLTAVEMSQDIEDWLSVQVTATVAWNYPTSAAMARYLAREVAGVPEDQIAHSAPAQPQNPSDFEQILGEIENLSDQEVERLLNDE